jgi:hypothetical protein
MTPPQMANNVMKGAPLFIELTIGYFEIMDASEELRDVDLLNVDKMDLVPKFRRNLLWPFFSSLQNIMVTRSDEAIRLHHTKASSRTPSPKKRAKTSEQNDDDLQLPLIQPMTVSSSPLSTPVGKKRVFSNESNESYGASSIETTPAKISQAEPHTESIQNALFQALIDHVWGGGARISWAENRKMNLGYRP